MVRRAFVYVFLGLAARNAFAAKKKDTIAPELDEHKLNAFSNAYNRYIARLNQGVIDLNAWKYLLEKAHEIFCKCCKDDA